MKKAFIFTGLAFVAGCLQAEPRIDQTAGQYYGATPAEREAAMDRMLMEAAGDDPVIYIAPRDAAE